MKFQTKAVPVLTYTQGVEALAAQAKIQYTAFAVDGYNDYTQDNGWVTVPAGWDPDELHELRTEGGLLRAFYPVDSHQQYMAAAAAQRDEE